jgi:hypothetical protein
VLAGRFNHHRNFHIVRRTAIDRFHFDRFYFQTRFSLISRHDKSGPDKFGYDSMRIGSALFSLAAALAGLMLLLAISDFLFGLSGRFPVVDVTALVFAAVILLFGFFCRRAF